MLARPPYTLEEEEETVAEPNLLLISVLTLCLKFMVCPSWEWNGNLAYLSSCSRPGSTLTTPSSPSTYLRLSDTPPPPPLIPENHFCAPCMPCQKDDMTQLSFADSASTELPVLMALVEDLERDFTGKLDWRQPGGEVWSKGDSSTGSMWSGVVSWSVVAVVPLLESPSDSIPPLPPALPASSTWVWSGINMTQLALGRELTAGQRQTDRQTGTDRETGKTSDNHLAFVERLQTTLS